MRGFRIRRKKARDEAVGLGEAATRTECVLVDVVHGSTAQAAVDPQEAPLDPAGAKKPAPRLSVARVAVGEQAGPTAQERAVKASFLLSKGLHARLKIEAARQGSSILALVSRWIEELTPAV